MYRTRSSVVVRASSLQVCGKRGRRGELTPRGQRCVCARPPRGAAWAQGMASGQPWHAASAQGRRGGLHGEWLPSRTWRTAAVADMGRGERAAIAVGGVANAHGRCGELAASAVCVPGQRGERPVGVGTGRGERAAVAGTGCGERLRLLRRLVWRVGRPARRRWVSFGAERCLNVALPGPPGRRGWQRGAGELRCGKLRCRALLCSYNVLALLDILRWWGVPPGAQAGLTTGAIMVALLCEGMRSSRSIWMPSGRWLRPILSETQSSSEYVAAGWPVRCTRSRGGLVRRIELSSLQSSSTAGTFA